MKKEFIVKNIEEANVRKNANIVTSIFFGAMYLVISLTNLFPVEKRAALLCLPFHILTLIKAVKYEEIQNYFKKARKMGCNISYEGLKTERLDRYDDKIADRIIDVIKYIILFGIFKLEVLKFLSPEANNAFATFELLGVIDNMALLCWYKNKKTELSKEESVTRTRKKI